VAALGEGDLSARVEPWGEPEARQQVRDRPVPTDHHEAAVRDQRDQGAVRAQRRTRQSADPVAVPVQLGGLEARENKRDHAVCHRQTLDLKRRGRHRRSPSPGLSGYAGDRVLTCGLRGE
jgi:hypothetical protein